MPPLEMRQTVGPTDPADFDEPGRHVRIFPRPRRAEAYRSGAAIVGRDGCGCSSAAAPTQPEQYVGAVQMTRWLEEWQPRDRPRCRGGTSGSARAAVVPDKLAVYEDLYPEELPGRAATGRTLSRLPTCRSSTRSTTPRRPRARRGTHPRTDTHFSSAERAALRRGRRALGIDDSRTTSSLHLVSWLATSASFDRDAGRPERPLHQRRQPDQRGDLRPHLGRRRRRPQRPRDSSPRSPRRCAATTGWSGWRRWPPASRRSSCRSTRGRSTTPPPPCGAVRAGPSSRSLRLGQRSGSSRCRARLPPHAGGHLRSRARLGHRRARRLLGRRREHLHDHREELRRARAGPRRVLPGAPPGRHLQRARHRRPDAASSTPPRSRSSCSRSTRSASPDAARMAASYDVMELSTAVKPWLLRHLLDRPGVDSVAYLDPDIQVFASLEEICPAGPGARRRPDPALHRAAPQRRPQAERRGHPRSPAPTTSASSPSAPGETAHALLDWWSERLEKDCVNEPERGRFVDQRWIDLAPGLWPGIDVLRDTAFNIAYWNLPTRSLEDDGDGGYRVDGEPLRFFHFSGFDPRTPDDAEQAPEPDRRRRRPRPDQDLRANTRSSCSSHGFEQANGWPYGWGTMPNGVRLDRAARRVFRDGVGGRSAHRVGIHRAAGRSGSSSI